MKKIISAVLCLSLVMTSSVFAIDFGDANGDGKVTADDVKAAFAYTLNRSKTPAADDFERILDMDSSGSIDTADVAYILQKVLDGSFKAPAENDAPSEPTTEPPTQPVTEPQTQPVTEPQTQPVTEPQTQPTTEPQTQPVTEPQTQPTTEPPTENTTAAPLDGVIRSDHTMDVNSFDTDTYFTKNGEFPPPKDSSAEPRIRLTPNNSIEFKVAEGANVYITAKHASTTTSGTRKISLSGNGYSKSIGYEMNVDYVEKLYGAHLSAGTYKITADNHLDIREIRITFDPNVEMPTETTTEYVKPSIPEVPSEITTTGSRVEVSNLSELKSALSRTNVDIYIMKDIECSESLRLDNRNANVNIIGVVQPDGTIPSLDFTKYRDSVTSTGEGVTGIRISGSGYSFENVIVEKAPDCGIRIKNSSTAASDCFFKNCIFRYNNNSGISMTNGTHDITFIGVDSYRNGDIVNKCGDDADGFSPKLGCGTNIYFYSCRAWENSDDGWDSYESSPYVGNIYYIECLAWNNGNPNVFTGEYDYKNGFPLDKNLLYVEQILREDPNFEAKFNAKQVSTWPKVTIKLYGGRTRTYEQLLSDAWGGNPNGFKFGSAQTPDSSYRYIENCIAFDHVDNAHQSPAKGYDQNGGSARFDIINGLSFDNQQNYWMDKMTALSQKGTALSFGGGQADTQKNLDITTPSSNEQARLKEAVHNYRDEIYSFVYNDKTPGIKLCPVF